MRRFVLSTVIAAAVLAAPAGEAPAMTEGDQLAFLFLTAEAALLVAPAVAYCLAYYVLNPRGWVNHGIAVGFALVAAVVGSGVTGISFRDIRLAALWMASGYVGFTFVVCCLLRVHRFRIIARAGGVVLVVGCLLASLGVIGVGLIVGEFVPQRQGKLTPDYRYAVLYYGNATTSEGGTTIAIYRRLAAAPFLERRVFSGAYDYREHPIHSVRVEVQRQEGHPAQAVVTFGGRQATVVPLP